MLDFSVGGSSSCLSPLPAAALLGHEPQLKLAFSLIAVLGLNDGADSRT